MIIYRVINRINRKVYIGQTVQKLSKRWKSHCQPSMSSRSVLSRAIQKYVEDPLAEEIIQSRLVEGDMISIKMDDKKENIKIAIMLFVLAYATPKLKTAITSIVI